MLKPRPVKPRGDEPEKWKCCVGREELPQAIKSQAGPKILLLGFFVLFFFPLLLLRNVGKKKTNPKNSLPTPHRRFSLRPSKKLLLPVRFGGLKKKKSRFGENLFASSSFKFFLITNGLNSVRK